MKTLLHKNKTRVKVMMCPSIRHHAVENPGLRNAFDVLDSDRDGKISKDDLCSFYVGLSRDDITDEDAIGMMMSAADSDRDGYVEYEEFKRVVERPRRRRWRGGVMEEVFRMMDRDGDGKLSMEDIKGFMHSAGINVRDEDVEAMVVLGGGDKEGSGGVCYDAFLKILGVDDFF